MRLLNVQTLEVELFDGGPRCAYAILSHTWGKEEVSFQDMQDLARVATGTTTSTFGDSGYSTASSSRTNTGTGGHFDFGNNGTGTTKHHPVTAKKGYSKILGCCAKARAEGYRYIWIDTCCIDKSSSAELSEAINSMYKWYHDAEVCYAYLSDITLPEAEATIPPQRQQQQSPFIDDHRMSDASSSSSGGNGDAMSTTTTATNEVEVDMEDLLYGSKWFTRGWTLQELIAPSDVVFCDRSWREIGTRESLSDDIAAITGIDAGLLRMERKPADFSVAQRMSWAATRRTTRVEDEAYCLMGLFDVNMPLLYGEGQKAFRRLQLEIMRQCYDPSILAWASSDSYAVIEGVLAQGPSMFESCGGIRWDAADGVVTGGDDQYNAEGVHQPNNFYHEIIGSSLLKMRVPMSDFNARYTDEHMVYRSYWDVFGSLDDSMVHGKPPTQEEEDPSKETEGMTAGAGLIYFPRRIDEFESAYLHDSRFRSFNYSFLKHKVKDIMLVPLFGCTVLSPPPASETTTGNENERYTVGITFCTDSTGHFKRVHFPSRFLVPPSDLQKFFTRPEPPPGADIQRVHGARDQKNYLTLHLSLTGTEILLRPPVPKWARCLVRIPPNLRTPSDTSLLLLPITTTTQDQAHNQGDSLPISLASTPNLIPSSGSSSSYFSSSSEIPNLAPFPSSSSSTTNHPNFNTLTFTPQAQTLPWSLSHTIPPLADDGSGCWYLDRWSEVTDRADFRQQPCFSLHKAGVPRALAFRHGMDPGLGFLLVFWVVRATATRGSGGGGKEGGGGGGGIGRNKEEEQWLDVAVLKNGETKGGGGGGGGVMWVKTERELVKVLGLGQQQKQLQIQKQGVKKLGGFGGHRQAPVTATTTTAGARVWGSVTAAKRAKGKARTRQKREWEFDIGEGVVLGVKIRKNPDHDLAVLDFREKG